eukprot:1533550-Amphidinium_carterae.1
MQPCLKNIEQVPIGVLVRPVGGYTNRREATPGAWPPFAVARIWPNSAPNTASAVSEIQSDGL